MRRVLPIIFRLIGFTLGAGNRDGTASHRGESFLCLFFQRRMPAAIAFAVAIASANAGHAAVSCKATAQHLVNLVKSNWPSLDARTPGATADMMGLLNKSPGFVPGPTRFKLPSYSPQALSKKTLHLQKPFTSSSELLNALDDVQGELTFFELPGTSLLAANRIGGLHTAVRPCFSR
jgi:hypothetical protein